MYLVDTNIFLEILLDQAKKITCKGFLDSHSGELALSDFSLHSIGVILFRHHREIVFKKFALDVLPNIALVTLSKNSYVALAEESANLGIDFDDTYQFLTAKEFSYTLVTLDQDFKRVQPHIPVMFL